MAKAFSVNTYRFDPYKSFRFLVYFEQSREPVAGVSKVGAINRKTDVISYKSGGDALTHVGMGRTSYDSVTLERGVTHDSDFEEWANAAQVVDKGAPSQSLKNLRRNLRIELLNEAGQPVHRYLFYNCWVSQYQPLSALDAGGTAVAIELLKFETEAWEHDLALQEPNQI